MIKKHVSRRDFIQSIFFLGSGTFLAGCTSPKTLISTSTPTIASRTPTLTTTITPTHFPTKTLTPTLLKPTRTATETPIPELTNDQIEELFTEKPTIYYYETQKEGGVKKLIRIDKKDREGITIERDASDLTGSKLIVKKEDRIVSVVEKYDPTDRYLFYLSWYSISDQFVTPSGFQIQLQSQMRDYRGGGDPGHKFIGGAPVTYKLLPFLPTIAQWKNNVTYHAKDYCKGTDIFLDETEINLNSPEEALDAWLIRLVSDNLISWKSLKTVREMVKKGNQLGLARLGFFDEVDWDPQKPIVFRCVDDSAGTEPVERVTAPDQALLVEFSWIHNGERVNQIRTNGETAWFWNGVWKSVDNFINLDFTANFCFGHASKDYILYYPIQSKILPRDEE